MNDYNQQKTLKIWQQNVRKSPTAQLTLLNSLNNDYDIICIQEPCYDFQQQTRATRVWRTVYPTSHKQGQSTSRSLILVHEKLSTNAWTQIDIQSADVVAIQLKNNDSTIDLYNIYNDCEHPEPSRHSTDTSNNKNNDPTPTPDRDTR
ncbi:hypothetical protein BDZ97DRAFT_1675240 [Flammula alnicola]|nr:hypothetical protein BDZ97DRAFT_1675240 [Flammula alnicola]